MRFNGHPGWSLQGRRGSPGGDQPHQETGIQARGRPLQSAEVGFNDRVPGSLETQPCAAPRQPCRLGSAPRTLVFT